MARPHHHGVSSPKEENMAKDTTDRLSDLPDCLLLLILSFLPTKEAIATSILSPRWRYVWTGLYKLTFNDSEFTDKISHWKFANNLYYVLIRTEPYPIDQFDLIIHDPFSEASNVKSWIFTAIKRNVKAMCLYISMNQQLSLPSNVFTSKTLKSLTLHGNINLNAFPFIHLPCLELLILSQVHYSNNVFDRLLPRCPILKYMHILTNYDVIWEYNPLSLTTLNLVFVSLSHDHKIDTKASFLRNLHMYGNLSTNNPRIQAENLQMADIRDFSFSKNRLLKFLLNVSHVQILKLCEGKIEVFGFGIYSMAPQFQNVERLELKSSFFDWDTMIKLIEKSPNLKAIVLTRVEMLLLSKQDSSIEGRPQHVPHCLESSLKEFHFVGFKGMELEMDALAYIMENAKAMKIVKLYINLNMRNKVKLGRRLDRIQKASESCEIYLD